jgi:hypothetical protein
MVRINQNQNLLKNFVLQGTYYVPPSICVHRWENDICCFPWFLHTRNMHHYANLNNKDEVIQVVNFKPRSLKIETPMIFLIYEPIMLSISWVKNDICWNCITFVTSRPKGFLVFIKSHITIGTPLAHSLMLGWWCHQQKQFV